MVSLLQPQRSQTASRVRSIPASFRTWAYYARMKVIIRLSETGVWGARSWSPREEQEVCAGDGLKYSFPKMSPSGLFTSRKLSRRQYCSESLLGSNMDDFKMRFMQGYCVLISATYIVQVTRPFQSLEHQSKCFYWSDPSKANLRSNLMEKKNWGHDICWCSDWSGVVKYFSSDADTPRDYLFGLPLYACYREACRKATRQRSNGGTASIF